MLRIIEVDVVEMDDLFEKYNRNKVSTDLINYIVDATSHFRKNDTFKIVINNYLEQKQECINFVIEGFREHYDKSLKKHFHTNLVQLIYFVIGIITLFLSTLVNLEVMKEVMLIGGWVLIWTTIDLEMFSDIEGKRRKRILKRLLSSEVVENIK